MNFSFDCATPESFVTSQWLRDPRPSAKYSTYRWILAAYFSFVLIYSIVTSENWKLYGIYLTNWNVIVNALSSLIGAILVTRYCNGVINLENKPRRMGIGFKIYWLLSSISTPVCLSVTILYWTLLFKHSDVSLNNSLTHGGNAVVLVIDVLVNDHPPRFGHFIYPMFFGASFGYLFTSVFTMLGGTNMDSENFVYPLLDWRNDFLGACRWSLIASILVSCLHFAVTFVAILRTFVFRKLNPPQLNGHKSSASDEKNQLQVSLLTIS